MILLASPSQDDLLRWEQAVDDLAPIRSATRLDAVRHELTRSKPQVLLLDHDLPELEKPNGITDLMRLSPETKVIVLSRAISDETEWGLFRTGIRGCCRHDIDPTQLRSVVEAVQQGELWIRRTLSWHLLNELVTITQEKNKIKQAVSDLLANLTRREYEIATLVGDGESNKQIARRLDITERTVKAHLTEVFRKLDVADRLKLALIVKGSMPPRSSTNLGH
ncbi:response regulator transcription factor [Nitrosovibrio sp. Nv17]|uniref:response regulator transcription factor n=1 Tax=Nitrosovibrio sp. Nv17 TaxID=1855339 RepID=UPI0009091ACC|nr:response regulator transcription factor [Nitrosovibrio sp. Nv17]SFW28196.1 DNA-binding response regulator, NarL/FixJ family, contains REC and HTH domains [Nitrosovibrio sp. Nv17]